MVALSKFYSEILTGNKVTCADVLHPTTTCNHFLLTHIPLIAFRTGQFFVPLYFIPLLANPKNITREKFIEVCKVFLNSVQTATFTVMTVFFMICTFSKYQGCVNYWTLLPLPSFIGSWSFYFSSEKVLSLFAHATSIINLEMIIRDGSIWPTSLIQRSGFVRTLLFMVFSGIILDSLYVDNGSAFWLFHPNKKKVSANGFSHGLPQPADRFDLTKKNDICLHRNSCSTHNKKIFRNYLLLGIALEAAKSLFSNFALICKKPGDGLFRTLKNININFLLFISGYPTLTNLTNCLLNRGFNESNRFNQTLSSIIGGIPFYFASNEMSIFTHTITTAVEALWHRYKKYAETSHLKIHQFVVQTPIAVLMMIFGGTFMYTARLFYPWLAPKFLHRLIDLLTNCKFDDISKRVHSIWVPEVIV